MTTTPTKFLNRIERITWATRPKDDTNLLKKLTENVGSLITAGSLCNRPEVSRCAAEIAVLAMKIDETLGATEELVPCLDEEL
jgi:hypothetical protein